MADYNATLLPVPRVDDDVREQDRYLPVANIARIMKRVLPPNEKIAKDAKEAVQECVSEFICFLTSEASDRCQTEKRKTINGDDLVWAMGTLGFDDYVGPVKLYLAKYRHAAKVERGSERTALRGVGLDEDDLQNHAIESGLLAEQLESRSLRIPSSGIHAVEPLFSNVLAETTREPDAEVDVKNACSIAICAKLSIFDIIIDTQVVSVIERRCIKPFLYHMSSVNPAVHRCVHGLKMETLHRL
mmetsp:Transcript_9170/g.37629  ORF Transcript_9170/g.37629 Transcript_9170/m.37629 type:complete len:244 (+) Transcript_9170:117-848(+)